MKHDSKTAPRKSDAGGHAPGASPGSVDAKAASLRMVDGRLVGPTLADPGMDRIIRAHIKERFPDREAVLRHFHNSGVLTKSGKLTKAYGG